MMHRCCGLRMEKKWHNRRECSAEVLGLQRANNRIMMPFGITFFLQNAANVKIEKNTCVFFR